jgi:hypothetical protein
MRRDSSPPPTPPPQAQPQLGYGPGYDAPPPPPPPNDFFSVAHEPSSIQDMSSTSRTSAQVGVMFCRLYKEEVVEGPSTHPPAPGKLIVHITRPISRAHKDHFFVTTILCNICVQLIADLNIYYGRQTHFKSCRFCRIF